MYDLIIIGAGPAGITAGVYAARKKMNTLVVTGDIGGQAAWSGDIENYTGYQFISGPELTKKFEEHIKKFNIELKEGVLVKNIIKNGNKISVKTQDKDFESKTLIIASGKRSRELGVPQEKKFKNKGLTYCATCDAPLFSDKDVAVIGGGNSALDAVIQLLKIAKHIYLINISDKLNADPVMLEQVENNQKVTIINNARVSAILGEKMVEALKYSKSGKEETIAVKGIFVEIGLIPNSEFVNILEKNQLQEIKINSKNETSVPGIFAAGDVTDVPEKQIIIAAGEGSKAALSAFRYLIQHKF